MLAALDAELGGIGLTNKEGNDEEDSEPDEPDPAIHQAELEKKVKNCTILAVKAKKEGDTATALKWMK